MTAHSLPWGKLSDERRVVLTSDQDWAPEWALAELVETAARAGVPLHVFRTSPSAILDEAVAAHRITQGWHPNFGPTSSHGADEEAVVRYCMTNFPGARSVRSHGFRESFSSWALLARAGIQFDSQFPSLFSAHLLPLVHMTGIIRLPVFLEDDLYLEAFPGECDIIEPVRRALLAPGLKILNFHAAHVGLNTPSLDYYADVRGRLYDGGSESDQLAHSGSGTRDLLLRLVDAVAAMGDEFTGFDQLCDEVRELAPDYDSGFAGPSFP